MSQGQGGGRPRKPTHLKVLEGNPGKRALPENEPEPTPGAPEPPEWLRPAALAEWTRIVPELDTLGMLTKVDGAALAIYCSAVAEFEEADELLARFGPVVKGSRGPMTNPALRPWRAAAETINRMINHLGLSPSARSGIELPSEGAGDLEDYLQDASAMLE